MSCAYCKTGRRGKVQCIFMLPDSMKAPEKKTTTKSQAATLYELCILVKHKHSQSCSPWCMFHWEKLSSHWLCIERSATNRVKIETECNSKALNPSKHPSQRITLLQGMTILSSLILIGQYFQRGEFFSSTPQNDTGIFKWEYFRKAGNRKKCIWGSKTRWIIRKGDSNDRGSHRSTGSW